jgi:hypothetical protein
LPGCKNPGFPLEGKLKLLKTFKGQEHVFEVPEELGQKLLKDKRYKLIEDEPQEVKPARIRKG